MIVKFFYITFLFLLFFLDLYVNQDCFVAAPRNDRKNVIQEVFVQTLINISSFAPLISNNIKAVKELNSIFKAKCLNGLFKSACYIAYPEQAQEKHNILNLHRVPSLALQLVFGAVLKVTKMIFCFKNLFQPLLFYPPQEG